MLLKHYLAQGKQGIEVKTADQYVDSGSDVEQQTSRHLFETDAVVALVSDPPSRFVEEEALAAHDKGFVLPVALGGATLLGKLTTLRNFERPDITNVASLAQQIASRVKDYVIPDET